MNTTTCHVCSQSVPLDDSGRMEAHRRKPRFPQETDYPDPRPINHDCPWCEGSGATPQAPEAPITCVSPHGCPSPGNCLVSGKCGLDVPDGAEKAETAYRTHVVPGTKCFYIRNQQGRYVAKTCGDSVEDSIGASLLSLAMNSFQPNERLITQLNTALSDFATLLAQAREKIAGLEAENERLKSGLWSIAALGSSSITRKILNAPKMAEDILAGEPQSFAINLIREHQRVRDEAVAALDAARDKKG